MDETRMKTSVLNIETNNLKDPLNDVSSDAQYSEACGTLNEKESDPNKDALVGNSPHDVTGADNDAFEETLRLLKPFDNVIMRTISNEYKLRLFGLYKQIRNGNCTIEPPPAVWQFEARAKYNAWNANYDLPIEVAKREYVEVVIDIFDNYELHKETADQCRALLRVRKEGGTQLSHTTNNVKKETIHVASRKVSNNQLKKNNSSPSFVLSTLSNFVGIKPLIPRGQLDISHSDLAFGAVQCVSSRNYQVRSLKQKINQQWTQCSSVSANDKVLVGLSVRTLLDLYLRVQKYPPGSEIIMSPPITVPGMIHVLEHHKIKIIGIDIETQNIQQDTSYHQCISVNVSAIQAAISEKTVAIMIVHPFGIITASQDDMKQIRKTVKAHPTPIHVLEDCAECFGGLLSPNAYMGSTYADIIFFSFGMIKTASALGGGIALFRHNALCTPSKESVSGTPNYKQQRSLFDSMELLYNLQYEQQTNVDFFMKVMKSFVLRFVASYPLLYGSFYALISSLFGSKYFDVVVTSLLRGFHKYDKGVTPDSNSTKRKNNSRGKAITTLGQDVQQIRWKPSPALLTLLHRRFSQATIAKDVNGRIERCTLLTDTLRKEKDQYITVPKPAHGQPHYYWLYPVLVSDPSSASEILQNAGFDATHGASQLCCIPANEVLDKYPNTRSMMNKTLYLPIAGPRFPESSIHELVETLRTLNRCSNVMAKKSDKRCLRGSLISCMSKSNLFIFSGLFIAVLHLRLNTVLFWVRLGIQAVSITIIIVTTWLWLFRFFMGTLYLNASKGFAKYNGMLMRKFERESTRSLAADACNKAQSHQSVLSSIDAINIGESQNQSTREPTSIFLTGATGFVGSMVLHDLLRLRTKLKVDRLIILCRGKRDMSGKERIIKLLEDPIFSFLSQKDITDMIEVVEGDVTLENAGMSDSDIDRLCNERIVSNVIHCAASVSFSQTLKDAALSNISSTLHLHNFTSKLNKEQVRGETKFIYISTSFVHGGLTGSKSDPLPEQLFSFGRYNPSKIYHSMLSTQYYASKAMADLKFPNTYTLSKSVCEHLLLQSSSSVNTLIIRPCIVGASVEAPYEGWAGRVPSTLVASACLNFANQWNLWYLTEHDAPCIPVDVLSRYIISKCFGYSETTEKSESPGETSDDSSNEGDFVKLSTSNLSKTSSSLSDESPKDSKRTFKIYNATWDADSPDSTSFTWLEYGQATLHVGALMGHFSRRTAYVTLFLTCKFLKYLNPNQRRFEALHKCFVQLPFALLTSTMNLFGYDTTSLERLRVFLDLPTLFYPFTTIGYCFKSELIAPVVFNGERYLFNCVSAAHDFMKKVPKSTFKNDVKCYHVTGPQTHFDQSLAWALSQPHGDFFSRGAGWFLAKLFSATCSEVTVDITSFTQSLKAVLSDPEPKHIILAPTHRSFFDFLLVSYVIFCLPELHLEIPHIIAADDFERLPFFGRLATLLKAFFIQRGGSGIDPQVRDKLASLGHQSTTKNFFIEIFIEGTRSRDRRFVKPKSGVLRCLHQEVGKTFVIPIVINYERLPEQITLCKEANGSSRRGMHLEDLFFWIYDVLCGRVCLGRIHVAASPLLIVPSAVEPNWNTVLDEIQARQQQCVCVSRYHIKGAANVLDLDAHIVEEAFSALGVPRWPNEPFNGIQPILPSTNSELFSLLLQASPFISECFYDSHPEWAKWLNRLTSRPKSNTIVSCDAIISLKTAMSKLFDSADSCVESCIAELVTNGFSEPTREHLIIIARKKAVDIPEILLLASVANRLPESSSLKTEKSETLVSTKRKLLDSQESLGFWGYHDSAFILRVDRYGTPFVTMEGRRYGMEGQRITNIIPFMEAELGMKLDPMSEAFASKQVDIVSQSRLIDEENLLQSVVSKYSFRTDDRIKHGTGHCQEDIYAIRQGIPFRVPDVVVWPYNEEEVSSLLHLAKAKGWCLFPYGGGTNVSKSTRCPPVSVEPRPIISVDMRKMQRILSIDEENGIAHVEAGITGGDLEGELSQLGYTMGHEPDSIEFSTLGGWIATKASGMKRSKYGNIEDIVLAVRVAGSTGVLQHGQMGGSGWGRESSGVDLKGLIFGSEGCLGIITAATVRIFPTAGVKTYDSILFPDLETGLQFAHALSRRKTRLPSSVRLLDNEHFRLGLALKPETASLISILKKSMLNAYLKLNRRDIDPKSLVCATIAYEGSPDEIKEQRNNVASLSKLHGGIRLGAEIGQAGYQLTYLIAYLRDFAMTYHILGESFETFVPWSKIGTVIQATKQRIRHEHTLRYLPGHPFIGARVTQLYHEGACIYFYFCMNFTNVENASQVFTAIEHAARLEILKEGGSLSHHHGIGKVRAEYLKDIDSPAFLHAIQSVKQCIDPSNVFGARNGVFGLDTIQVEITEANNNNDDDDDAIEVKNEINDETCC